LFAVFSKSMEFAIAYVGSLIETSSGQWIQSLTLKKPVQIPGAAPGYTTCIKTLSSSQSGVIGRVSIFLQQSANVEKLAKGSNIIGLVLSAVQLICDTVILARKNGILSKISGLDIQGVDLH
jgi:hypothetical protein